MDRLDPLNSFFNSDPLNFIDPPIHFDSNNTTKETETGAWPVAEKTDAFVFSNSHLFAGEALKQDGIFTPDVVAVAQRSAFEEAPSFAPEVAQEKEATPPKAVTAGPSSTKPDRYLEAIRAFQSLKQTGKGCIVNSLMHCGMEVSITTEPQLRRIISGIADCFFHEKSSGIRISNESNEVFIKIFTKRAGSVKATRILNFLSEARGHEELYLTYHENQSKNKRPVRKKAPEQPIVASTQEASRNRKRKQPSEVTLVKSASSKGTNQLSLSYDQIELVIKDFQLNKDNDNVTKLLRKLSVRDPEGQAPTLRRYIGALEDYFFHEKVHGSISDETLATICKKQKILKSKSIIAKLVKIASPHKQVYLDSHARKNASKQKN